MSGNGILTNIAFSLFFSTEKDGDMRKALYTLISGALAVNMALSPICAYAETAAESKAAAAAKAEKTEETGEAEIESIEDPEAKAKDAERKAATAQKMLNFRLGNARQTAGYLLKNDQGAIIKQEVTDESTETFPEKFDLRDKGVVTPVKFQNPWGTCWGFSAIAAAETSILSSMEKTYAETGLDLSEHQLTYFVNTYLNDGSSQDGEGVHMYEGYEGSEELNTGNEMFAATSVFSMGIGVVDEETIPYRGKNSDTDAMIIRNFYYSANDDWTIPDEYKFLQSYELINSDMLPSPAVYEENDDGTRTYLGYNQSATDNMKRALMEGKAISVAYAADQYSPDQLGTDTPPLYLNVEDNKWTQYTYDEDAAVTHAVTIVGWDDTIRKEDFLDHSEEEWNKRKEPYQPAGDGAWIIKNSWGAATEEFPNYYTWGIKDENGKETGYFYLSYYDKSISLPETFDFDTNEKDRTAYIIDQYNYLQASETSGWVDTREMAMANVFTAEYDEVLRSLSCQTNNENTQVSFEVYLLDDSAAAPDDGELAALENAEFEYSGYHRVDVSKPVHIKKGQKYSIVVTQKVEYDDKTYYAISTSKGYNKEAVDEYNRQVAYDNRGMAKIDYEDQLLKWYTVGVVNPGESYLYVGQSRNWNDLSEVIPELQKYEAYREYTFDNFPIRAYLDYENEADIEVGELPDLGYAEPAGPINMRRVCIILAVIIILILLIVLKIRGIIKRKKMKKLVKAQQKEIAELKAEVERYGIENMCNSPINEACDKDKENNTGKE